MAGLGIAEHLAAVRAAVAKRCVVSNESLRTEKMGLDFSNPVGLAGGFDKNAHRPRALAALGFGFLELGTVTALAQEPNPRPNLFRLPKDRALVNRLGFPNDGAAAIARRIEHAIGRRGARREIDVPVGVSIGKSRAVSIDPIEDAVADYVSSFEVVRRVADFVVVNISSPNTKDLRSLQGASIAKALLEALVNHRARANDDVPLLVKVAPDLDDADLDALFDVVGAVDLAGVVATNTTIGRAGLVTDAAAVRDIGAGGLSGPPLFARALDVTRRARERLGPEKTIVGVGGIANAHDARAMFAAGADLIQVYTAFIYGGPLFVHRLLRDIATGDRS
jgi:dihydroorotate dehydrogenase